MSLRPNPPQSLPDPPLLLITDRHQARQPLEEVVAAVFEAGCRWLLVREKDLSRPDLLDLTRRLLSLGRPFGASVMVSGASMPGAAAARESGAAGVHLPRDGDPAAARTLLGPEVLIGLSAHDLAEARRAERLGADYVTLSPLFESASKPGYGPALGLAEFGRIARALAIPALALGGVTAARIPGCLAAGAAGAAVMGEVMRAANPGAEAARLVAAFPAKGLDLSGQNR